MNGLDADQLQYLQDVLGISSVVLPEAAPGVASVAASFNAAPATLQARTRGSVGNARLIAVWGRLDGSGEAEILAEKMVSAMKVQPAEVVWIDWDSGGEGELPQDVLDLLESAAPRPILVFGEATAKRLLPIQPQIGRWLDYKNSRYMITLSPEELLSSAEKKKTAWAHLQIVMKEL